jgi:hypothetical protein
MKGLEQVFWLHITVTKREKGTVCIFYFRTVVISMISSFPAVKTYCSCTLPRTSHLVCIWAVIFLLYADFYMKSVQ